MSKGDNLGELEHIVLLVLARLGDEAYGMAIADEIETRAGRKVAVGAVYSALDRMERKGMVTSVLGRPTKQRGGRAKRFYALREPGLEALRRSQEMLQALWDGLDLDRRGAAG
jgi:PadR family transcriptional regulator PadR